MQQLHEQYKHLTLDHAVGILADVIADKPNKRTDLVTVENGIVTFVGDHDKYTSYQILKALYESGESFNYRASLGLLVAEGEDASLVRKIVRQAVFKDPVYEGTYKRGQLYGTYASWKCLKAAGPCAVAGVVGFGLVFVGVFAAIMLGAPPMITLDALIALAVFTFGIASTVLAVGLIAAAVCLIAAAACFVASPVVGLINENLIGKTSQPDQQVEPKKIPAVGTQKKIKWQHVRDTRASLRFFPSEVVAQIAVSSANNNNNNAGVNP